MLNDMIIKIIIVVHWHSPESINALTGYPFTRQLMYSITTVPKDSGLYSIAASIFASIFFVEFLRQLIFVPLYRKDQHSPSYVFEPPDLVLLELVPAERMQMYLQNTVIKNIKF